MLYNSDILSFRALEHGGMCSTPPLRIYVLAPLLQYVLGVVNREVAMVVDGDGYKVELQL